MSPLQWALLVVGVVAVVAIYVINRRERSLPKDWSPPGANTRGSPKLPGQDQLDMFNSSSVAPGQFDEFGVGKPRVRHDGSDVPASADNDVPAAPAKVFEEKIVTLLLAQPQGQPLVGAQVHHALSEQRLQFGERKIYHRLDKNRVVFSVASLVKPGTLDPAEQQQLATPGLTVFMVLPGPTQPRLALQDMIATTRALAEDLGCEVFDATRQPFNSEAQRVLITELDAWAKRNGLL